jgi:hypothetical protein
VSSVSCRLGLHRPFRLNYVPDRGELLEIDFAQSELIELGLVELEIHGMADYSLTKASLPQPIHSAGSPGRRVEQRCEVGQVAAELADCFGHHGRYPPCSEAAARARPGQLRKACANLALGRVLDQPQESSSYSAGASGW